MTEQRLAKRRKRRANELAVLEAENARLKKIGDIMATKPVYYECGICDHCHPWDWNRDCREDANRLTEEELDNLHGQDGYELRSMDDRVSADITIVQFST